MEDTKERFRRKTASALRKCAKWLEDNTDALVNEFSNDKLGCASWSLTFSFDPDRYPDIVVDTDCKMVGVVEGTYSS